MSYTKIWAQTDRLKICFDISGNQQSFQGVAEFSRVSVSKVQVNCGSAIINIRAGIISQWLDKKKKRLKISLPKCQFLVLCDCKIKKRSTLVKVGDFFLFHYYLFILNIKFKKQWWCAFVPDWRTRIQHNQKENSQHPVTYRFHLRE